MQVTGSITDMEVTPLGKPGDGIDTKRFKIVVEGVCKQGEAEELKALFETQATVKIIEEKSMSGIVLRGVGIGNEKAEFKRN